MNNLFSMNKEKKKGGRKNREETKVLDRQIQ